MKILKENLRRWNKGVFYILDLEVESTVKELNELDHFISKDSLAKDTSGVADTFLVI